MITLMIRQLRCFVFDDIFFVDYLLPPCFTPFDFFVCDAAPALPLRLPMSLDGDDKLLLPMLRYLFSSFSTRRFRAAIISMLSADMPP